MTVQTPARKFTAALAVREQVPLLLGLMGPSGGGKTFSALRLATGIQRVTGGEIYFIDTEARRGLHYADQFKFRHVPFEPPFGSLDYLAALKFCAKQGPGTIIVDSMSHEHEGPGGLLDYHEEELTRMAGENYGKREAMKMLAWGKPKANRRQLINGLLQMNCNFIFCFRAKNSVKPVKVNGKTEVIAQGFMPIAGEEFVFEMTLNALLLPGANGVPTWSPEHVGEKLMSKLPQQFRGLGLQEQPRALDEKFGEYLARWARGEKTPAAPDPQIDPPSPEPASQLAPDDDDFPGDPPPYTPPASEGSSTLSLSARVAEFKRRIDQAGSTTKLTALGNNDSARRLRADLERSDPEAGVDVGEYFTRRFDALEAEERGGQ